MLSDEQVLDKLEQDFAAERRVTQNILIGLKEVVVRRLYAKRGYDSLYSMLIKHYRQSEPAANQRIKALQLMIDVKTVEDGLLTGELSLSTVAMAQRQIARQEKVTGRKLANDVKCEIVESITGKTLAQAEMAVFRQLPEAAMHSKKFERRISAHATRIDLPNDVMEIISRLKELWAHVDPAMDSVAVIRRMGQMALDKVDPLRRKPQPVAISAKHRGNKRLKYYGRDFDAELARQSGGQCEYVDQKTGRRCECRHGLEREHKIPLALGGTNELSNMEMLCRTHNQLRARQVFGDAKMDWQQKKSRRCAVESEKPLSNGHFPFKTRTENRR